MKQLHDYYKHIMQNGEERQDRTGTGTIGVFGYQMRFDLRKGFPLVTSKKLPMRLIFEELAWFLRGETNIKSLLEKNVHIWDDDAYRWYKQNNPLTSRTKEEFLDLVLNDTQFGKDHGDLGDIYGKQWRSWETELLGETVDQISNVIKSIKEDPYGRRHIVSAWNPADLSKGNTALPPCHILFQFWVSNKGELSCQLYQRSADSFLGVPFNIASYALLVHMIASVTGYSVGEFIHTIGDAHIYKNHYAQIKQQISREPRELPTLTVNRKESIFDITWEDIQLIGYNPHAVIKGKVSVGE